MFKQLLPLCGPRHISDYVSPTHKDYDAIKCIADEYETERWSYLRHPKTLFHLTFLGVCLSRNMCFCKTIRRLCLFHV